ncbi:MAG: hypothetical protein GF315_12950 [candidate division Zixibacteria bacterium]|nr:hypothetical protein [candidate division Zixibacteria bacterium]
MSSEINNLIRNLDRHIDNLEQVESVLLEQRDLLTSDNVEGLKQNLLTQGDLISQAKNIESERGRLIQDYLIQIGKGGGEATLRDLIEHIDPSYSGALKKLRSDLKRAIERIEHLREQNQDFIRRSLDLINDTVRLYYNTDDRGTPAYNSLGNNPESKAMTNATLNEVI